MARGTLALLLVTLFLLGSQHTVSGQEDAISEVATLKASLANAEQRIAGLNAQLVTETTKAQASSTSTATIEQRALAAEQRATDAEAKMRALATEAEALREAKTAAESTAATAQQSAQAAAAARDELDAKVRQLGRVEADLNEARAQLAGSEAAQAADKAEIAKAQAAAAAAEAKAEEAQKLADNLIAQHYNEWVPHWVADGYERRVRPAAVAAYTTGSEGAATLYRTSSAKAGQLYSTVSPTVQPYVDYASTSVSKVVKHPHLTAAKQKVLAVVHTVTNAPPVKLVRAKAAQVHAELEGVFSKFFGRYPLLAPLGAAGVVGWVVTALLSAPLLALLLPALLLNKKQTSSNSQPGSAARAAKARKGRRITQGGDSVNFA